VTLAILRERTSEGFVVHLIGDLDDQMAATVMQAIVSTPELSVVVDLSELSSLDASGLRALLGARDHLAREGKSLSVVGARDEVMAAFRSSDLEGVAEGNPVIEQLNVSRGWQPRRPAQLRADRSPPTGP
jgi:anti-anti-sigma factor